MSPCEGVRVCASGTEDSVHFCLGNSVWRNLYREESPDARPLFHIPVSVTSKSSPVMVKSYEPLLHYVCKLRLHSSQCRHNGLKTLVVASSMIHSALTGCHTMLFSIKDQFTMDGLSVEVSKRDKFSGLNELFTHEGLKGSLQGEDYLAFDYIFQFSVAFCRPFSWACGHAR